MSSMPPNMPPGGTPPIPPHDPRNQWRVYQAQQKAAWRAQREAWKAQRHAWKAARTPSIVGPIILIAIGIVGLLIYTGRISGSQFWSWYGHWWPTLLILAGLALLGEWFLDQRRGTQVSRSGGFIGVIVLLALLGIAAAGWNNMAPWFHGWNGDQDDFFSFFGMPEHDTDQVAISQAIPANALVDIENPRGDISIAAGDDPNLEVLAHQVAFSGSDADAQKIFDSEKAAVTVSGNTVLIKSNGNDHGKVNLTITVPRSARVTVNAGRGDLTVAGLGAGLTLNVAHGDTQLNSITGPIQAHFAGNKHDFSAHQIQGDLSIDGNCNDLTLSEFKGSITLNGEIYGEVHMENVSGPVKLHTSITDIQLAALPGDLSLDSDNLRVNTVKGAIRVITRGKDIDLSQIYGDSFVQNRDGRVAVEPAGAYSIEVRNSKGDVEIALPPNASATVVGHTHNGDIVTDYGLAISGEEDKSVTGRIGSGAARISLTTDNGDLRIKTGQAFPAAPSVPAPPPSPAPPNSRHLKSSHALPAQPVTQ